MNLPYAQELWDTVMAHCEEQERFKKREDEILEEKEKEQAKPIVQKTEEPKAPMKKTPSKRQEKSDLRIIGAMYDILRTEEGRKNFGSDNELIGYLEENYQGEGISRSSLLDRFSKAKKLIVHNKKKPPMK